MRQVVVDRDLARQGRRPELGRALQLLGRGGQDLVETVVPEAAHAHWQRLLLVLRVAQLLGQLKDALDVIVVDMTDQERIDDERLTRLDSALLTQPLEARLEVWPVDVRRPAINHDQAWLCSAEVQDEAVALAGAEYIETKEHHGLP
jgi:hypothetical protein